jgi:hypothetical protein
MRPAGSPGQSFIACAPRMSADVGGNRDPIRLGTGRSILAFDLLQAFLERVVLFLKFLQLRAQSR